MSIQQSTQFTYQIIFDSSTYKSDFLQPLLESILELIPNSSIVYSQNESKYSIHFYAKSVTYFHKLKQNTNILDYNKTICMIHDINKQQLFLNNHFDCGFFYIDFNHLLIIDSYIFVFIHPKLIRKISHDNFVILYPFYRSLDSTLFFSPEIFNLNQIPAYIKTDCFYYSLASFAIYCLFGIKIQTNQITPDMIEQILKPIYQTKLYWTIFNSINKYTSLIYI